MWQYSQGSGELKRDGETRGHGYAGAGPGKNNPLFERLKNIGPIPRGLWTIMAPIDSETVGPFALPLRPRKETITHVRSNFLVHGDSKTKPGEASRGCIILSRKLREEIWNSKDRILKVVR